MRHQPVYVLYCKPGIRKRFIHDFVHCLDGKPEDLIAVHTDEGVGGWIGYSRRYLEVFTVTAVCM